MRLLLIVLLLLLAFMPVAAQEFATNTPPGEPVVTEPVIVATVEAPAPDETLIPVSVVDDILASASEQSRQVLYVMGFILGLFIVANGFPALRYIYNSVPAPFKDVVKSAGVGVAEAVEGEIIKGQELAKLTAYEWDDEAMQWLMKWAKSERSRIEALGKDSAVG